MRVVDTARMNRLGVVDPQPFEWDMTKVCILILFLGFLGLYKRFKDLGARDEPFLRGS